MSREEFQLGEVVFSSAEIKEKVSILAQKLNEEYAASQPVLICVLKGAVFFTVDLSRKLSFDFDLEFIALSRFSSGTGKAVIEKDVETELKDREVLIVEDIVDTGLTLHFLINTFQKKTMKRVRTCTLLDCPARRIIDVSVDYSCFEIPDIYVVGYGLDFRGKFRNLDEIRVLKDPYGRSTQILKKMGKERRDVNI